MRIPKAGTRTFLIAAKAAAAALYPWGQAAVRAWAEKKAKIPESAARARSRALARENYPAGKALARVRYFETQRGLTASLLPRAQAQIGVAAKAAGKAKGRPRLPYAAASATKQRQQPAFRAAANLPVWRELGPTLIPHGQTYGKGPNSQPSVSGRCVGIEIDPANPRRLLLCSAGGGIWGTQDGGATWQPLTDQQPALAMGAIARAPSSPNLVYAATGEGDGQMPLGVGLLRSSDGGQTWSHVPAAALAGEAIYDIAIHPSDPLHLWIGGTFGLYESTDGGASVQRVRGDQTWDISIDPATPSEMLAGSAAGLLQSSNGGGTWARVGLPGVSAGARFDRIEVCHAPSNPAIVYVAASVNGVAKLWRRATASGNFSAEQVPAKMNTSQAWYDWCFAVAADDPNFVIWGAIELYRGTRAAGSMSWSNISSRTSGDSIHPDQHHVAFDPGNPNTLYACNDGGLFRSDDRGTHWTSLNPGLAITEFEFLAQLESDPAWLIGGTQDNGTIANGGARRWDQIALGDGGDCGAADGTQPVCFHSYYGMWIERAAAKGPGAFNWEDASPPAPEQYPALFYPPMDVRGKIVSKAGKTVFVSSDSGNNWNEIDLPTSSAARPDVASALVIVADDTILVGTVQGHLYRIRRSAADWSSAQVLELASPRAAFVSDIVKVGTSGNTAWVSSSAIGGGHVYRSTNGGQTWLNRSGNLPDIPINALVVDPANRKIVYAASDHGVYKTANSGRTWSDFSNGLPNVIVGDLILHESRRLLRAGTRNRGVWEVGI